MDRYKVIQPQSEKEFELYFKARFETLRKPWGKPAGSERDEQEDESIHFMVLDENEPAGVCRLQKSERNIYQLRYMGVYDHYQGKGIGRCLINAAEKKAKDLGACSIILHARENAVEFYKACGYTVMEKSYLMWDSIQHFLMKKDL